MILSDDCLVHPNPSIAMMKYKIPLLVVSLILLALALAACSGSYYASTSWPGLAANDEYAFVANNTFLYAVKLDSGEEAWRYPAEASAKITFFADPVLTPEGELLVASYDHKLYSIDPADGSENWVFEGASNRLIASPLVTEEGIFQASADGNLYALDFSGDLKWTFITGGPVWAPPAPNVDCTCLFVASMDHHVYAVDAITGDLIWKSDDLGGAIVGTPAFDHGDTVIVGTFGSEIIALDAKSGEEVWSISTQGWVWSGGILHQETFYAGDLEGYIYGIDAATGEQIWRVQPGGAIIGSPILVGDQLVFTSETDTVFFIGLDGEVNESRTVAGQLYTSPFVAGDLILIAPISPDTLLVALTTTGAQQWTYFPEK
jgi:outer membrane protein assembly factor BamB